MPDAVVNSKAVIWFYAPIDGRTYCLDKIQYFDDETTDVKRQVLKITVSLSQREIRVHIIFELIIIIYADAWRTVIGNNYYSVLGSGNITRDTRKRFCRVKIRRRKKQPKCHSRRDRFPRCRYNVIIICFQPDGRCTWVIVDRNSLSFDDRAFDSSGR